MDEPVNAGSYPVTVSVTDPDFEASATDTLVMGKATAILVLANLSHTYDGTAKPATATTMPEGRPVSLTYHGSPNAPVNAGTYAVIGSVEDPNYQGGANGTLVITDMVVTLTISVERGSKTVILGWPNGFQLQSSPVLPATDWRDVAGSETTNIWRVPIGAGSQFYRVKR